MPGLPDRTCTGCGACAALCPHGAITMKADSEGFLYPETDRARCTDCGLCERRCPVLGAAAEELPAYACMHRDKGVRRLSSSGGVFSACAQYVLEQGGAVFGARFDGEFAVMHGCAETPQEAAAFRGSKYVQSGMNDTHASCRRILEAGRPVLFSGLPCQIAGLRAYLKTAYEELYCIDCICHGVPSPLLWKKYIEYRSARAGSAVRSITFRCKDSGWKQYTLVFAFENGAEYRASSGTDPYLRLFLRDCCLREACYRCAFKKERHVSDLTVGDFWGIEHVCPELDDNTGTSVVFVQSPKGARLLDKIKPSLIVKPVSAAQSIRYNPSLVQSAPRPALRDSFYADLQQKTLPYLFKKYAKDPFLLRCARFAKRILKKLLRLPAAFQP